LTQKIDILFPQEFQKSYVKIRKLISWMMSDHQIRDFKIIIKAVNDDEMADLNQRFKGILGPTDVLTFILEDNPLEGEIYVCLNQASMSAVKEGTTINRELFNLVIHGTLHLLGYHHNSDEESKENEELMKKYGNLTF